MQQNGVILRQLAIPMQVMHQNPDKLASLGGGRPLLLQKCSTAQRSTVHVRFLMQFLQRNGEPSRGLEAVFVSTAETAAERRELEAACDSDAIYAAESVQTS